MNDYLVFAGAIIPMVWGKATYTVLPLPAEISDALAIQGTRH